MKYVITGGAGFIGSTLAEELIASGKTVLVIDDLSTGRISNLDKIILHTNFNFIKGDANSRETWKGILDPNDVIIHLSATVGVLKVCENPLQTIHNNFKSTKILLDLALHKKCKVLFASTSEVYGDKLNGSSQEDDPATVLLNNQGRSAYVLGKLLSEHYCLSFFQNYKLPVIIVRLFNVIGPRQASQYGMVVPTFLQQALTNREITVFGDGSQQRSFCDVRDITRAFQLLLHNDGAIGEIFNIGSTESISISDLANFIKKISYSSADIKYLPFPSERSGGSDIHYRKPSILKIKSIAGWAPEISWKDTISGMLESLRCKTGILV